MKELCELAEGIGFEPKTFSTRWTFNFFLERGKIITNSINKECEIALLAEIQEFLRIEHGIYIIITPQEDSESVTDKIFNVYAVSIPKQSYLFVLDFSNEYSVVLKLAVIESLKQVNIQKFTEEA